MFFFKGILSKCVSTLVRVATALWAVKCSACVIFMLSPTSGHFNSRVGCVKLVVFALEHNI